MAVALASAVAAACARVGPLPGGETDVTPPRLVETVPEALSVGPVEGPVILRFDERLSERGVQDAVRVSPATGRVEVDRSGRELRVRIEGGWRPGNIYLVTVAPTLEDLFQNVRTARTELVFSTGPPIEETAVAGIILDRITGDAAAGAQLSAFRTADSTFYVTAADSVGFAALRYVPRGTYEVVAYRDQNRNGQRDPLEAAALPAVLFLDEANDTSVAVYHLLPGDTTPARLLRAESVDSAHVRLTFDDYLDPLQDAEEVTVELLSMPDSAPVDAALELLPAADFDAARESVQDSLRLAREDSIFRARVDSIAAVDPDSAAVLLTADSVRRAARTAAAGPADDAPAAEDSLPVPSRDMILRVSPPLQPGDSLAVRISAVRNLTGLRDGGGQVVFRVPEPGGGAAAALPASVDTAAARPREPERVRLRN
jgi:hypothetical protein